MLRSGISRLGCSNAPTMKAWPRMLTSGSRPESPPASAADEGQDFAADPLGVALVDVDADALGADPNPIEADVDQLLQSLGAVFGVADDPEAVDELVAGRLLRVEGQLAGFGALRPDDAAGGIPQHRFHRLQRVPVLTVLGVPDVGGDGLGLEAGEAGVGGGEAADRRPGLGVGTVNDRHLRVAAEPQLL